MQLTNTQTQYHIHSVFVELAHVLELHSVRFIGKNDIYEFLWQYFLHWGCSTYSIKPL